MKRILTALLIMMCTAQAIAQNSLETIHPEDWRHYYFNYRWWDDPLASARSTWMTCPAIFSMGGFGMDGIHDIGTTESVQWVMTNDTLRVIGIATCAGLADELDCMMADNYRTDDDEYLRIYKPVGDSMVLIDEGVFNIHRDTAYFFDAGQPYSHGSSYPTYEVYFGTTHIITDSFYVGLTMHNNYRMAENNYLWPTLPVVPCLIVCPRYSDEMGSLVQIMQRYKERWADVPGWSDRTYDSYIAVWPILEDTWPIEKRCPAPDNLNAITLGGGSSITWDGPSNQTQWQLSYSTLPNQPDSGTIVDLNSNYWYHSFNDSTMNYVYVRGYCHNERCWSLWSAPLEIGTPADTSQSEGIRTTSTLDSQTRIFPNPASESVTITCGFTLEQLELCSLQGQILLSQKAKGHAASMDVSTIQPGTYLMIVHTAAGRTAKRLVIQ